METKKRVRPRPNQITVDLDKIKPLLDECMDFIRANGKPMFTVTQLVQDLITGRHRSIFGKNKNNS